MRSSRLPPYQAEQDGIRLRPFRLNDVDGYFSASRASVETVGRWLSWLHRDYARHEAEQWVAACVLGWGEPERPFNFVIEEVASQRLLGGLSVKVISNPAKRLGNIGFWVRSDTTGRGVATMATRLAVEFGFDTLQLPRLEIGAAVDNLASRRVAEKAGFQFEGVLRLGLLCNGQPTDEALYSLIAADREAR
ncbi:GNAT family N-acetyltransferase [Chitinimonas lacunae]|uniref:GNAT family N-acetyltransferase n=1 Tax=Chitinimonas lacunae TaxID=1963018 RepID=A0ABV8MTX5_9NEIS